MSLQLILNDNSAIDLAEVGYTRDAMVICLVNCADAHEFKALWDQMTDENLILIKIVEDGKIIQTISDLHLESTQTIVDSDRTLTGYFYLRRNGEYLGDEYSEAGRILLGQEA